MEAPTSAPPAGRAGADAPRLPTWTWILPILLFHLGTGLSLKFPTARGLSLWSLALPAGIALVHWWGPRVLVGLYLNGILTAGYWGFYRWQLWPLYALPATLKVGLSWWIFARLVKGKAWMPDLDNLTRFLALGAGLPCILGSLAGQVLFVALGDAPAEGFWQRTYSQIILDALGLFAITVPAMLFGTSFLERAGLSLTHGAHPRVRLFPARMPSGRKLEVAMVFLALVILSFWFSIERFWPVYGFILMWAAVRFGIGLASLATLLAIGLGVPLHAFSAGRAGDWETQAGLIQMNLNLATLGFAALVVGRALSDLTQQVEVRARIEDDLRKNRFLLEYAQDIARIGYLYVEPATGLRIWSRNLKLFYGLDPDGPDPDRETNLRILSEGGANRFAEQEKALMEKGEYVDDNFVLNRPDGEKRTLRVVAKRENASGDRPAFIAAVFQDVTEWAALQRKAREEEDKYRTLFESAADAIFLAEEGRILATNPAALRLFRCEPAHLIGRPATVISPPAQPDGTPSTDGILRYRSAALAGNPQRFEWTFLRADGTLFEAETSLDAVEYGGRKSLLVGIRDISPRKRMERALMESEERFRQMAENIQEIFFLLDCAAGSFLYVSPIARDMLGLPIARLSASPALFVEGILPEDRERAGIGVPADLCRSPVNVDVRYRLPEGGIRWLRLRSFLVPARDGSPYRVAGVIADITEYKTAQEEADRHQQRFIQADKMNSLGLMVSGVAHEVNNPNNLIMLNADVMETFWKHMRPALREHAAAHPEWRLAGLAYGTAEGKFETLLSGVAGGAKRIKRIVESLKDFARLDRGDLSEAIDLDQVVDASVGVVESVIRKSTDNFSVDHAGGLPRVKGNFQKLEQVVINLITNACQALESRAKAIRIATWHDAAEGWVGIRVEDEGKGIPAELVGKVTDPFFTTKRDAGGTGLGLSVSYGIVREHRGRMEIRSEVARGTQVEIRIPAMPAKATT